MTTQSPARVERRHSHRIALKGTVILLSRVHSQRGRISNISAGGVLATTAVTSAAQLLGRTVDLELRFDGPTAEWLRLVGRVMRIDANAIAILFESVSSRFIRLIEEMSTAADHHRRVLSVVLVDETTSRRLAMAEAFRSAGCNVVDVSSTLEAIVRLGELSFEPNMIAIADSTPSNTAEQLRVWVDREHPRAKLITIGDGASDPDGLGQWLSAADPSGDLAARVRHVLTSPRHRA